MKTKDMPKMKIKLKTEGTVDAAHHLEGYDGDCSNVHGHTWRVVVWVEGEEKDLDGVGIMWDFSTAKMIKDCFDHKTILKFCEENEDLVDVLHKTCGVGSVFMMAENPTAENLADVILTYLKMDNPELYYTVKIYESPKSCVEASI